MKNILITGGAGFIGSHVVRLFLETSNEDKVYNLDALTYAGNLENLRDIENHPNYSFIHQDIVDLEAVRQVIQNNNITHIVHLAAESHVDRSIKDPLAFVQTNVIGTVNLLQAAKEFWGDSYDDRLFYHVRTDEVYGSLSDTGFFYEDTAYDPRSPYSASKASSDHFVRAYHHTYGLPVVISNCSNNYGPNQYSEKLIPLIIKNIIYNEPITIYGDGKNIRDWLYVEDHVSAIDLIFHKSKIGETYNIGGNNEMTNNEITEILISKIDHKLGRCKGKSRSLITYVKDRLGHDKRYAIDNSKIKKDLGWIPKYNFNDGIDKTIAIKVPKNAISMVSNIA